MPYRDITVKKAADRAYYLARREETLRLRREAYAANKETILARNRAWRTAHADRVKAQHKAYYEANKEKYSARNKEYREANPGRHKDGALRRAYGITLDTFNAMLAAQGGRCAMCPRTHAELPKGLHVDHCHDTGKVRALLCNRCNVGLGHFRHSREALEAAIAYLEQHRG